METEKQMMYAVVITTHENESRGYSRLIGIFSNHLKATEALDDTFHKMCDRYGVKELNCLSYYDEGDSFNLEGDDSEYMVECTITGAYVDNYIDDTNDEDNSSIVLYKVSDIEWDVEDEDTDNFPTDIIIKLPTDFVDKYGIVEDAIAEYLANQYGWCVLNFTAEKL